MHSHGARVQPDGKVCFRLWAPACDQIRLEISGRERLLCLSRLHDGWHELSTEAAAGDRYFFVLPDGMRIPDPASSWQPEDVHGASEVIHFCRLNRSRNRGWSGIPWEEAVLYELHVGAFTPEGTFRAAINRLDHLCSLNVTAIELMPIADFPGQRNWGYDGVLPFAPDSTYGSPEDLMALIDAAHERGIMVLLDVVYNHFGPEGNYLGLYAPEFFSHRHQTAWGKAINFDGPASGPVREFFIQNAIYWLEQYGFDGLRFDAVHAIIDQSAKHILREISERIRTAFPTRRIHLLLENEENQACWLEGDFTAQWNDDLHHVLHTAITGEGDGYYQDYLRDDQKLGRALAQGFAFQGEIMEYRGTPRGTSCVHLSPTAFVAFLQNHDQVGNRAFGDRISTLAQPEALRAATAVYALLPQVPMIFMGEEWSAEQPFPFFCDFGAELADDVRKGRRLEFSRFPAFQDPRVRETIPDPQSDGTFNSAKLQWSNTELPRYRDFLEWYRRLLSARRRWIVPVLGNIMGPGTFEVLGDRALTVEWRVGEREVLALSVNLSAVLVDGFRAFAGDLIWSEGLIHEQGRLGPWSVRWSLHSDPVNAAWTGDRFNGLRGGKPFAPRLD
jgi:malto-oligosyltrehalose trehalohydrolase